MASQFTIYSSSDAGAGNPGPLTGQAGDLIRVLNLILVAGYTGKAAAGWTNPVATSGNIASYKNASPANSGNGFGLVINDNGPNVTASFQEAWATGWESVAGVGAPVGSGSGQFPTAAQALTTGHVVIRKSFTASATARSWVCFADSLTFYLFIFDGSVANSYQAFFFGDIFSLGGSSDDYRCLILGRTAENSGGASASGSIMDCLANGSNTAATLGAYLPRTFGGGGISVQAFPVGASGTTGNTAAPSLAVNVGTLTGPNGADNSYYTPPIWVLQIATPTLRGRFRGLYHTMHPAATFADGQVITGAGDFSGKTLQVVKQGVNAGLWLVETSNTLETN